MEGISQLSSSNLATKVFNESRDVMLSSQKENFDKLLSKSTSSKHITVATSVRDIALSSEKIVYSLPAPIKEKPEAVSLKKEVKQVKETPTVSEQIILPISKNSSVNDIISEMAKKYGVSEKLVHAVVKTESNYKEDAVSQAGAMGLMQLMPATAKWLGVKDAFNPRENIEGGVKYLSQMIKKYDGDIRLSLAAYNAGPGNVDKYGGVPPFKETQNYVKKILG